jgi:hypothetical protein
VGGASAGNAFRRSLRAGRHDQHDDKYAHKGAYSQQQVGIRNGAEEDAAFAEVLGDILEHHARFGDALKGVVHAELHGDGVERAGERRCGERGRDGFLCGRLGT